MTAREQGFAWATKWLGDRPHKIKVFRAKTSCSQAFVAATVEAVRANACLRTFAEAKAFAEGAQDALCALIKLSEGEV